MAAKKRGPSAVSKRAIRSGIDERAIAEGCYFDLPAAHHVREFFREFLCHSKGEWAGQPFLLLPWQWDDVVKPLFGWKRRDGSRRYRKAYIEIAKKSGKALALDTPLPTPDGWTAMGDIDVGATLFDENGETCTVVAATSVMLGRPCHRVHFSDDTEIIADADHEWQTRSLAKHYKMGVRTTAEIAATISTRTDGARNHSVPVAGPLQQPNRELPIHPYVLGIWLGDGHSTSGRITCGYEDLAIIDEIRNCGETVEERPTKNDGSGCFIIGRTCSPKTSFQARLRQIGVFNNKHIPVEYLRASIPQRVALLQGLMDSDGYAGARGQCEFTTTKETLRDGMLELLRGLGHKPMLGSGRATIYGKDCGPKYRVRFHATRRQRAFRLERKWRRQLPSPDRSRRCMMRQIVSADAIESVPVRCIEVDSPSRLYLAGPGMVPTHNSTLCAGLSLYLLIADGEIGAEVYSAAADREQAGIVFREAATMVRASRELADHVEVIDSRKRITFQRTGSYLQALSRESGSNEGLNIHGLIFDELHAQKTRDLWDALTYGGAARRQPLAIAITTAGFDRHSICYEQREYALQVLDGRIPDWTFFPYVCAADEGDDWTAPQTWAKANPSLGVTVKEGELAEACAEAQASPLKENSFKRYRLNIWTEQDVRFLQMNEWDACGSAVDPEALRGRPCYAGLDLASTRDLNAFVLFFPDDGNAVLPYFWIPQDTARERERRDKAPYLTWAKEGLIELTPGNVADYDRIRARVNEIEEQYDIQEIAIDRWNSLQLQTQLDDDGFTVVPFGQGMVSMSAPTKELERLILARQLAHGGHPVLRWMAGNISVKEDAAGNIKPDKDKSTEKIDGIVALIMAIGRAMVRKEGSDNVYDERGLLSVG